MTTHLTELAATVEPAARTWTAGGGVGHDRHQIMKPFEVTVMMPAPEPALHMKLDADHWMEAWKIAMGELGLEGLEEGQVTCKIRLDGAVEVIMPDRHGRRFLVAAAGTREKTTQDRPAAANKRSRTPTITIEELRPVRPDDTMPELHPARGVPTQGRSLPEPLAYPKVYELSGGEQTSIREAVAMLASHVEAEQILFLVPSPDWAGWTVALSRGQAGGALDGARLAGTAPIPGPVDGVAGRRRYASKITLTFAGADGIPTLLTVRSALWAPVRSDGKLRGVFVALNAHRPEGFASGEFEATQQLATLVTRRMQPA